MKNLKNSKNENETELKIVTLKLMGAIIKCLSF